MLRPALRSSPPRFSASEWCKGPGPRTSASWCNIHPSPALVCTAALADGFIKVLFTTLTLGNKLTAEIITRFKTRMTDPDWNILRGTECLGTSGTLRIWFQEKHPYHCINHFLEICSRDRIWACVPPQEADLVWPFWPPESSAYGPGSFWSENYFPWNIKYI